MHDLRAEADRDDPVDVRRALMLGLWTTALAVVFTALLVADTVSATSF